MPRSSALTAKTPKTISMSNVILSWSLQQGQTSNADRAITDEITENQ